MLFYKVTVFSVLTELFRAHETMGMYVCIVQTEMDISKVYKLIFLSRKCLPISRDNSRKTISGMAWQTDSSIACLESTYGHANTAAAAASNESHKV